MKKNTNVRILTGDLTVGLNKDYVTSVGKDIGISTAIAAVTTVLCHVVLAAINK